MTDTYRLKFKSEIFEVEIEGPDETIINEKLIELIELSHQASRKVEEALTRSAVLSSSASLLAPIEEGADEQIPVIKGRIDPAQIAEFIKSSKRYRAINNRILKKSNQLYRILLSLHYSKAIYGAQGFSTGFLEEVTATLGKRLRKSNIAAQIKLNPELFDADREPGKGVTALYLLTEAGVDKLEDKLNS